MIFGSSNTTEEARTDTEALFPADTGNAEQIEPAEQESGGERCYVNDSFIREKVRRGARFSYDGGIINRIWRVLYPFAADLLIQVIVGISIATYVGAIGSGRPANEALTITIIADFLMIPLFWWLLKNDDEKRLAFGCGPIRIPRLIDIRVADIPAVVFFMICACRIFEVIISLTIVSDKAYEEVAGVINSPGLMFQLTAVAVIGPIMEELLFRGVIYRRVRDYIGFIPAVVISSITFGVAHGNLTQGIFASGIGILLALLYEHYGTIIMPIAAHIANNLYAVLSSRVDHSGALLFLLAEMIAVMPLGVFVFSKKRRKNAV